MQVVILAAGMGSRYQGLKQLDTFGPNRNTLMEFSIHDAINSGFDEILFIIRRDFELEFRRFLEERFKNQLKYEIVFQEMNFFPKNSNQYEALLAERVKPWGTAHALFCAKDKIKGDFLIINADDFYGSSSYKIAYDFLNDSNEKNALVAYKLENTLSENGFVSRGICRMDEKGNLLRIDEIKKIKKNEDGVIVYFENEKERTLLKEDKASMNMFTFRHNCLDSLEEYMISFFDGYGHGEGTESYLTGFIDYLILEKKCFFDVLESREKWFGVTYKEDKEFVSREIESLLREGHYSKRLFV